MEKCTKNKSPEKKNNREKKWFDANDHIIASRNIHPQTRNQVLCTYLGHKPMTLIVMRNTGKKWAPDDRQIWNTHHIMWKKDMCNAHMSMLNSAINVKNESRKKKSKSDEFTREKRSSIDDSERKQISMHRFIYVFVKKEFSRHQYCVVVGAPTFYYET